MDATKCHDRVIKHKKLQNICQRTSSLLAALR